VNGDGTLTYAPNAGWYGSDTFNFWLADAYGDMAEGTATVTVNPAPPTANPGMVTTQQGSPVTIDLSGLASDPNMSSTNLTYSVSYPQNGTVSLSADGHTAQFSPDSGFAGETEFTYTVTDPTTGLSASSLVTVTVNGTISAPNASASVHAGNPVTVYAGYSGGSISSFTQGAHGSVQLSMGGFLFTPSDLTYTGNDTFQYTVSDGNGHSATGTITITMTNSPPVANSASTTIQAGQTATINPPVSDPDGDTLTVSSFTQPTNGTVTALSGGIGFSYTPNDPNFTGTDSFTYTISDGHGGMATGTITITVTSSGGSGGTGNSPPLATGYTFETWQAPITLSIQALASDPNGYSLSIISVTQPMSGTVSLAPDGQSLTYTNLYPVYFADSFTYTVSDGHGGTATGIVYIYP